MRTQVRTYILYTGSCVVITLIYVYLHHQERVNCYTVKCRVLHYEYYHSSRLSYRSSLYFMSITSHTPGLVFAADVVMPRLLFRLGLFNL